MLRLFYGRISSEEDERKSFIDETSFHFLSQEEKLFVDNYFLMLGRGDSVSQKGYFSSVKEKIVGLRNRAESEAKKYGDLYIKLGFLCGLLILILIV